MFVRFLGDRNCYAHNISNMLYVLDVRKLSLFNKCVLIKTLITWLQFGLVAFFLWKVTGKFPLKMSIVNISKMIISSILCYEFPEYLTSEKAYDSKLALRQKRILKGLSVFDE